MIHTYTKTIEADSINSVYAVLKEASEFFQVDADLLDYRIEAKAFSIPSVYGDRATITVFWDTTKSEKKADEKLRGGRQIPIPAKLR